MPDFRYRSYNREGIAVEGDINATTREAALDWLARSGQYPVAIGERKSPPEVKWWQREVFASSYFSVATQALFTRELVSLVRANLPVHECLRLVSVQPMLPAKLRHVVRDAVARVAEGEALSEALAAQPNAFPEYYCRIVKAGETSGSLTECLDDLALHLERSAETRASVTSALLYPLILVIAALLAIGVIVLVLLPAITPMFADAGVAAPFIIRALGGLQNFLSDNKTLIFTVSAGAVIAITVGSKRPDVRLIWDRGLLRVPVVARLIERRESGRLARTLATLLRNGVPLLEAVRVSSGVVSNIAMRKAVVAALDEIKEGGQLSTALMRSKLFSELLLRLVTIGEQTGQLDIMLLRAAEIYESALQRQMQRLTNLVTPVVTLMIGALVGGLILTVMNALISINDLALR